MLLTTGAWEVITAQVPVTKSSEKVVIRGQSYYIHIVEKGQTAFSIARAYSITVEILHSENPEALYGLKEGQVLKIPVVEVVEEPEREKDLERFIYHTMVPGETIFALSRKYDVSQHAIIEANPGLDPADIPIGMEVAIPRKDFKTQTVSIAPQKEEFTSYRVKPGETMASIARRYGISTRELRRVNGGMIFARAGDTIRVPGRYLITDDADVPVHLTDSLGLITEYDSLDYPERLVDFTDISNLRGSVDIAVMLPLFLSENAVRIEVDSTSQSRRIKHRPFHWIYPGSVVFLEMYEGILIAANDLRDAGMEVRIHTFDTRAERDVIDEIIYSGRLRNIDLIIGPVYSYNLERVVSYAERYNIPVVSPVPLQSSEILSGNRNVFLTNPSTETIQESLSRTIARHYEDNLVFIYSDTSSFNNESFDFRNMIMRELSLRMPPDQINFKQVLYRSRFVAPGDTMNRLSHTLNSGTTNVIILGTENESALSETLMNIHGLLKRNSIIVYSYPSIRNLEENIDLNYLFDSGINFYTPFNVDYGNTEVLRFLKQFRETFGAEPAETSFAWLGYDITAYFVSGFALHGRRFMNNPGIHNPRLLHARFDFRRDRSNDGFENWGLYHMKYTGNMDLVVVEEIRHPVAEY
ncbi:MAG: LysM peptidoglycan-binding domain-containing protein [Bacteroidales bacterium]